MIGGAIDTYKVMVEFVNIGIWNGKEVWIVNVDSETDFKIGGMEDSIVTDVDFRSGSGGGVWERLMMDSFKMFS